MLFMLCELWIKEAEKKQHVNVTEISYLEVYKQYKRAANDI